MTKDWSPIEGWGGLTGDTREGIWEERSGCYPDGWIEDSILIGRPIGYTQI